ncbi:MAG: hypothetical protein JXP73_12815 [Deltaproteobacteria bacterium]|nr:hypothetical protein [Deltaproteobacteria bacterium]
MSPKPKSGIAAQPSQGSASGGAKAQFDTFETKFFEQGDAGAEPPVEVERFDDLEEPRQGRKAVSTRQFLLGVAVGSMAMAVLGCLGLWLAGKRSAPPAQVAAALVPAATGASAGQADPASVPAATTPAVAAAAPGNPEPSAPSGAPAPAAPVAADPDPAPALPAAAPGPVAALPEDKAASAAVPAPVAEPPPASATQAQPTLAAEADPALARSECREAIAAKRGKAILATCPQAFATDPGAADIAVALAKIEFERGRSAQALAWGKKAVAADANAADAYVFIGGAEQSAGRRKAAVEAYRRYLRLAPNGHYAADLRAIVGSAR